MHSLLLVALLINAINSHHSHKNTVQSVGLVKLDQVRVVDSKTGIAYNPYSRHHPGRHVCTTHKNVTVPVKTKEKFCKPVYQKYVQRCNNNQWCTGVKLVYETAYRDVETTKVHSHLVYSCCPGWFQVENRSVGCNRPQCGTKCQNGGSCAKPDSCSCIKGFTGRFCENDIDECKEQKPCDQICHNTIGSFKCECKENFALLNDGQSCRKEGDDGSAFEAKDLEYDLLDKRLFKLEELLSNNRINKNNEVGKMAKKVEDISNDVDAIKGKLKDIESYILHLKSRKKSKLDGISRKSDKVKYT